MKQKCTCHVGIFHGEDLSSIRCNGNCQKQNFWKDLSDVPSFFIFLISALMSTIVKKLFKRKKDLSNTCFDGNCPMAKSTPYSELESKHMRSIHKVQIPQRQIPYKEQEAFK